MKSWDLTGSYLIGLLLSRLRRYLPARRQAAITQAT
jgi:hypothetical protein